MSELISWREGKRLWFRCVTMGVLVPTTCALLIMAQTPQRRVAVTTPPVPSAAEMERLSQRPLQFPALRAGEPCPVSKGSRQTVPHVPHIFCSECLFFGRGPAYFALIFLSDPDKDVAVVNLDHVYYREGGVFSMKTPWVTRPDYSGPVLARGRRLDGEGKLGGVELEAPWGRPHESDWSFWPTGLTVTGAGCYGIQIDTDRDTDVVVFKATGGDTPYRRELKYEFR